MLVDVLLNLLVIDALCLGLVQLIVAVRVLQGVARARRILLEQLTAATVVVQEDLPCLGEFPVLIGLLVNGVVVLGQLLQKSRGNRRVILLHGFLLGIRPCIGGLVLLLDALADQPDIVDEVLNPDVRLGDKALLKSGGGVIVDIAGLLQAVVGKPHDVGRIDGSRTGVGRIQVHVQIEQHVLDGQRLAVREPDAVLDEELVDRVGLAVLLGLGHGVILGDRRLVLAADDVALGIGIQHADLCLPHDGGIIRRGGEERVENAVRRLDAHGKRSCLRVVFLPGRVIGVCSVVAGSAVGRGSRAGSATGAVAGNKGQERRRRQDQAEQDAGEPSHVGFFHGITPFGFGYAYG